MALLVLVVNNPSVAVWIRVEIHPVVRRRRAEIRGGKSRKLRSGRKRGGKFGYDERHWFQTPPIVEGCGVVPVVIIE